MQDVLIVVDMQNDFIDGTLGTPEAVAIVPKVAKKVQEFTGKILFTRDTHEADYLETREGKNLPVKHCIRDSRGWQICSELRDYCDKPPIDKMTFGSVELGSYLLSENEKNEIGSITLIGLCTDICVISNALLLKAFLPETDIVVDAACCAGVTPENHRMALSAMKACQIRIEND